MQSIQEKSKTAKDSTQKIKWKIAVMSGKGGVGKTTIAVNIAAQLAKEFSTALMDADIDCPNVTSLLGVTEKFTTKNDRLIPIQSNNMKICSMSCFDIGNKPIIWRGPMIHNALLQFLSSVEWGDTQCLVIDMPPGTSDAALTMLQFFDLDAIIGVTTSHPLSLEDATRMIQMAQSFNKRLGIVENMSGDVFGSDGGKKLAQENNVPFLGSIPFTKEIARDGLVMNNPSINKSFETIVKNIKHLLAS